jgi:membrane associated rhomboid family serine protease
LPGRVSTSALDHSEKSGVFYDKWGRQRLPVLKQAVFPEKENFMPTYRFSTASPSYAFGRPWTPAVRTLIIANIIVFVLQNLFAGMSFLPLLALQVPEFFTELRLWQPVTYLFLHAGFWHLLFNMFTLWMFGCEVELRLGTRRFYFYYFLTGIGAGLCVALISRWVGENGLTIGASGAIFGVLMAYGVLFAERVLTLLVFFVIPVTMKARTMVLIFAGVELLAGVGQAFGHVSHLAHLSGLAIGYLYFLLTRPKSPSYLNPWKNLRMWWLGRKIKKIPHENHLDEILEKISTQGIGALSAKEREILSEASRRRKAGWPGEN